MTGVQTCALPILREVLERRFKHGLDENETDDGFSRMPDLILLDGGKGQVNAVEPILREMGVTVPIFGMVKDNNHRTRAIATSGSEISISGTKSAFMLVTRIQDEVHRFSITYQRSKHRKQSYETGLTQSFSPPLRPARSSKKLLLRR